jgi:hypothetical protein
LWQPVRRWSIKTDVSRITRPLTQGPRR